jgi:hypothetical protein
MGYLNSNLDRVIAFCGSILQAPEERLSSRTEFHKGAPLNAEIERAKRLRDQYLSEE